VIWICFSRATFSAEPQIRLVINASFRKREMSQKQNVPFVCLPPFDWTNYKSKDDNPRREIACLKHAFSEHNLVNVQVSKWQYVKSNEGIIFERRLLTDQPDVLSQNKR
jgi:hypothetical protein